VGITPLFWYTKNAQYTSSTLFPLFSVGGNKEKTKKHLLITPLYWNVKQGENYSTTLFPLWWSRKTISEKTYYESKTLFPIFWHTKQDSSCQNVIFPLWWSGSKTTNYGTEKYRVLFPLLYTKSTPHYQSITFVPLLSVGHNASKTQRRLMVTPLFWNVKNDSVHTQMLLPLYYVKQNTAQQESVVNILGLLYDYRKNNDIHKYNVLFPLASYSRNGSSSKFHLFPIVWKKQNESNSYFHLLPIYSQLSDSVATSRYVLGPLFTQRREGAEQRNSMLWFLFQWNTKEIEDYQFRILYRFIYNENWNGVQTYGVMPFFHISKNENSCYSKNFGFGFYSKFRRKVVGYDNEFYEETRILWVLRIRSNYQYLKGKGIDVR
jgi:hypothetical protein